jgi:hypothetical protein
VVVSRLTPLWLETIFSSSVLFKDVHEILAGQNGSALRSKVVKDMCWNIYITKEEVTGYD